LLLLLLCLRVSASRFEGNGGLRASACAFSTLSVVAVVVVLVGVAEGALFSLVALALFPVLAHGAFAFAARIGALRFVEVHVRTRVFARAVFRGRGGAVVVLVCMMIRGCLGGGAQEPLLLERRELRRLLLLLRCHTILLLRHSRKSTFALFAVLGNLLGRRQLGKHVVHVQHLVHPQRALHGAVLAPFIRTRHVRRQMHVVLLLRLEALLARLAVKLLRLVRFLRRRRGRRTTRIT